MATIDPDNLLHIDIETRSYIDLNERGTYVYADKRYTDILIIKYALGDAPVKGYWPWCQDMPSDLADYFADDGLMLAAHNAQFERLLFQNVGCKYGIPALPVERYFCTMYQMYINNLPASLANAGRALHARMQKDERGKFLIRQLSKPMDDGGNFNEDPELLAEFDAYCAQDVETERDISKLTRMPSRDELEHYWVSEHINDVGILIDRPVAEKAVTLASAIADEAEELIEKYTKGEVLKARGPKLTQWVYDHVDDIGKKLMTKQVKNKETGDYENKITLDRNAREALVEYQGLVGLPRQVVEVAESVGSGSVAKFNAMVKGCSEDNRVRGSYLCAGAPATGRYSARRVQMHNFSRDTYPEPQPIIDEFLKSGHLPDSPMLALKRLLRPSLMAAPGKLFVCSDWSAIEGRFLPWVTNDRRCEAKLEIFRRGECVYMATATDIYRTPVTEKSDPKRQVGKVAELALGYQGAAGSFKVMGANYGVDLPVSQIDSIVHGWRGANPGIVSYWYDVEAAALKAVDNPGTIYEVGRVAFYFHEDLCDGTLWCKLPSGRLLSYPNCSIEWDAKWEKYALASLNSTLSPKAGEKEWPRRNLYGGLLVENITQAGCADLLREALRACWTEGFPVVGHTHDEILLEVPEKEAGFWKTELEDFMLFVPDWAQGLPLAVESWVGPRFRK